ncbi:hypothetical protein PEC301296_05590 [Pectobacterium carotovorum subsp. carotovorum]|nr:hypothetical protein PEC301296_05590 [Pectobacterium carotovorum subsp. carotovorum]
MSEFHRLIPDFIYAGKYVVAIQKPLNDMSFLFRSSVSFHERLS